ncbi:helix-turn-helix domain-containing protein [Aquibium carbonis]|uniref:Helix-turn-helix domain-containing protein n=1 Tax=Aquibium carbonis TaxID=2495581 RepID=A0A429YQW6_9HYPH|nr:helix-turn-helix domain-containing protein [Aquibium carbonis]RST83820.1 helix-turn-helix domain-containing protein [Aquibium carbonis]
MQAGNHWTSGVLPPSLRAEGTRAMLSSVHLPWSLDLPDRAGHDCSLTWHDLGGCSLIECRSAPLSGHRDQADIRRTQGDHVGMLLVLSGEESVRQDELSTRLGPGDMLLWDGARPIRFEVTQPLHKVTLLIPRERFGRAATAARGALRLESRNGLGALAAGHLAALTTIVGDIPAGHAPLAADILVDLLGRLVEPRPEPATGGDLLARILGHIEANLEDPDLTPSRLAARFGISVRYLHMLFSTTGGTVSAHVRARRLAAMRRDLADPRLADSTITQIAFAWGFGDAAHASRAFSAAYGLSPSRWRAARRRG